MPDEWKEYGGYKDDQGNIRVGVDTETLEQETGLWVAGKISMAMDSLEEATQSQIAVSGNRDFENNMGRIQTAWPKDVGKKVWIRVRGKPEGWAGPYVIIKSADPELIYQWQKDGKIAEVSNSVADQLGISETGVMGELAWMQKPPPSAAGEAKNESHPIGLGSLGVPKIGPRAGTRANFAPRLEQMPPGASMPLMQAATGLSASAIGMGGRTDMRIGGNPVESAVTAVREARASWATDVFTPVAASRSLPGLNWPITSPFTGGGAPPPAAGGGPAAQGQGYTDDTFFASYEEGRTGDLNKLYELQMAGMPQSAISEYAQANGMSFEAAVNALHANAAVDDRWATDLPWFYDIAQYGPGAGMGPGGSDLAMNIADAARAIGIDVDNIPLDELLYSTEAKGGEFGEGSEEHWKWDTQVGWTDESFGQWTARRAELANSTDDDGNLFWAPGTVSYDEATLEQFQNGEETATMTDGERGGWNPDYTVGDDEISKHTTGAGPGISWMFGKPLDDQMSAPFDWETGQTARDFEFGQLQDKLASATEATGAFTKPLSSSYSARTGATPSQFMGRDLSDIYERGFSSWEEGVAFAQAGLDVSRVKGGSWAAAAQAEAYGQQAADQGLAAAAAQAEAYAQQVADQGPAAAAAQAQAKPQTVHQRWQEQQDEAEKARKRRAAPEYVEDVEEWAEENPHKMEEEQRKEEADVGFENKPEYMKDMPKEEWMAHYGHRYGV